jgi:DNA-binding response OmpR family regulator
MSIESLNSPGKILVVEDENVLLQFVCLVLERSGFPVIGAADGDEGWALFNANRKSISLVLTDIVMPGAVDGFELHALVKEIAPEIPVLFMSGALPLDGLQAQELIEKNLLLHKPFVPDQLLAIVREHLTPISPLA